MVNKLTVAGLGAMVLATVLIIVMYGMIPIIGDQIDTAITIRTNAAATGTLTFSGIVNGTLAQTANISTETYTFTNGTSGAFYVDVGSHEANATYATSQLVAEITANSTLVTAVDNGDNSTTVTAILTGTTGNAYTTTENLTNAAWGGAVLSGGVDGSQWDSVTNTDMPTGPTFWVTVSGFVTLSALMLFIAGAIAAIKGFRS